MTEIGETMTKVFAQKGHKAIRMSEHAVLILNWIATHNHRALAMTGTSSAGEQHAISGREVDVSGQMYSEAVYDLAVRYIGKEAVDEITAAAPNAEYESGMSKLRREKLDEVRDPETWAAGLPVLIKAQREAGQ